MSAVSALSLGEYPSRSALPELSPAPISVSSALLNGYDDPEILPSRKPLNCLKSADGGHEELGLNAGDGAVGDQRTERDVQPLLEIALALSQRKGRVLADLGLWIADVLVLAGLAVAREARFGRGKVVDAAAFNFEDRGKLARFTGVRWSSD